MRPLKSFRVEDSKYYVSDLLNEELRYYRIRVPEHPDQGLAYYTSTWNPLTMIASAMIPEAVHMGSANAVGLSTLAGFLAAISFKLLE